MIFGGGMSEPNLLLSLSNQVTKQKSCFPGSYEAHAITYKARQSNPALPGLLSHVCPPWNMSDFSKKKTHLTKNLSSTLLYFTRERTKNILSGNKNHHLHLKVSDKQTKTPWAKLLIVRLLFSLAFVSSESFSASTTGPVSLTWSGQNWKRFQLVWFKKKLYSFSNQPPVSAPSSSN